MFSQISLPRGQEQHRFPRAPIWTRFATLSNRSNCGSPFNLCPACLVTKFLPKLRRKHPNYSRQKLLCAAIEVMEAQLRQDT